MKSIISIIMLVLVLSLCLVGCKSNIPDEPAQTRAERYTYINPMGATTPNKDKETTKGETTAVQYVETPEDIQLVFADYYVFGNSVAKIKSVEFSDYGIGNVSGFADVEMIAVGRRSDDMRIGYSAYDANDNLVRSSYLLVKLDDKSVKEGSVCENRRFDFPRDAVRVEFYSYIPEE